MTNRAVQIYDDNPELIKLKSDINNIQNWKVVRESFRQFKAARPGPNVIVRNYATGICYKTSEKYPWVIIGIRDAIYVDSDDLKLENLLGHPVNLGMNSAIRYKRGYSEFRVAGAKHQDSLKGSSAVDLQNCRQFYAFYLNPNKYDANALSEFTLTVDNEYSKGAIRNGAVKRQIYGLGNFLVCRTYGEMPKPDFTTIDLIPGDEFIQRFNAKPFGLKKIDEAIEQYKLDTIRGTIDNSGVCKTQELHNIMQNLDERKRRVQESEDKINKNIEKPVMNSTNGTETSKNDEDIKSEYVEYLVNQVLRGIDNIFNNLVSDESDAVKKWYEATTWIYTYNNLPKKLLDKIKSTKSMKKPDAISVYKMCDSDAKVKLKSTMIVTVNSASKENMQFKGDVSIVLIAVIKKGKDKKYKKTFTTRLCGDVDQSLSKYTFEIFKGLIHKTGTYASED